MLLNTDGESATAGRTPLIVHVIHHLGVGGLENGLVNLINHMPAERYRHAIICLKGCTDFRDRIARKDVEIVVLNKCEGHDVKLYWRLYKTLRRLRPDIVHTRNLAALEGQVIACLARVPARVHGEHGRDVLDLYGQNRKYNLLRRAIRPFIAHFIAVSRDLEDWLINTINARPARVTQVYNGVDSVRFRPRAERSGEGPAGFFTAEALVIGSVGRMAAVKDFPTLVRAFLLLRERDVGSHLRLLIVGDGDARSECMSMLRAAGAEHAAWLPGERSDIPDLMRTMDLFVLPSLGEGISNTILEAMACGLPVVATDVGGNTELVHSTTTGKLVPPGRPEMLAEALFDYCRDPLLRKQHGMAARQQIENSFSMEAMTAGYLAVYDKVLDRQDSTSRNHHVRNCRVV